MAQPIAPLGEQPNLDNFERCWSEILVEVRRVRNIPALTDSERIIAAIGQMTTQLETQIQGVETRLEAQIQGAETRLEARIQGVETQLTERINQVQTSITTSLKAYDANAMTRVVNNNNVAKPNHDIEPLLDVATGTVIPDFPTTVDEIMHLQAAQANAILTALGASTAGGLAAKRARIKLCCGLVPSSL
ncbi:hypothetical protein B0T14DRAFT_4222 [Immersiella caudata]|uniref:Uncharacterized protein n=1 Tax=Immersiella caudata TaxID=314043 RepID=A0AA39XDQ1_9PEZI|nr:hypothetical protein B0T14DRAFT_4222 [Immersiella caudata]